MKIDFRFIVSIAVSILLSACATGSVKTSIQEPLQLELNERVAVIEYPTTNFSFEKLKDITNCFFDSFHSNTDNAELVNVETIPFRDILTDDPIGKLFTEDGVFDFGSAKGQPVFQDKILPLRFRYLILIEVSCLRKDLSLNKWYEIECGAGAMGGAGCGGLNMWDNQTYMKATILDLNKEQTLGELEAEYSSRSWILALGLPIAGSPDVSDTEACKALGKSVATFFQPNK